MEQNVKQPGTEYQVITMAKIDLLHTAVNDALTKGWVVAGGIMAEKASDTYGYARTSYHQAMTRTKQ